MEAEETLYETLGVDRACSSQQIKKAYHKIALRHHPDRDTDGDVELFKRATLAYETLRDGERRQEYDQTLATQQPSPSHAYSAGAEFTSSTYAESFYQRRPKHTRFGRQFHQHTSSPGGSREAAGAAAAAARKFKAEGSAHSESSASDSPRFSFASFTHHETRHGGHYRERQFGQSGHYRDSYERRSAQPNGTAMHQEYTSFARASTEPNAYAGGAEQASAWPQSNNAAQGGTASDWPSGASAEAEAANAGRGQTSSWSEGSVPNFDPASDAQPGTGAYHSARQYAHFPANPYMVPTDRQRYYATNAERGSHPMSWARQRYNEPPSSAHSDYSPRSPRRPRPPPPPPPARSPSEASETEVVDLTGDGDSDEESANTRSANVASPPESPGDEGSSKKRGREDDAESPTKRARFFDFSSFKRVPPFTERHGTSFNFDAFRDLLVEDYVPQRPQVQTEEPLTPKALSQALANAYLNDSMAGFVELNRLQDARMDMWRYGFAEPSTLAENLIETERILAVLLDGTRRIISSW